MADSYQVKTEYGKITIGKSVIVRIVKKIVDETGGVRLAMFKEFIPRGVQNIDVSFGEDGRSEIRVFVVVRFGTSLSVVTYHLINEIRTRVITAIGVTPARVAIVVCGTEAGVRTIKRNLLYERRYDTDE